MRIVSPFSNDSKIIERHFIGLDSTPHIGRYCRDIMLRKNHQLIKCQEMIESEGCDVICLVG